AEVNVAADAVGERLVGRGDDLRRPGRAVARGVSAEAVAGAGEQVVAARGDDRAVRDGGDGDRRGCAARAAPDQRPAARAGVGRDGDVVVRRVVKLHVL